MVVAYGDHLPTLELTGDDMVNGTLFQTQYFVWSNFGAGVGGEDEDLSAYQLTAHLFDIIGMAGGAVTEYHREHRGLDDYQEGLEMLEYDLLYGDLITYGGKNPYTKTDMKMGLDEIVVTGVVFGESTVVIIGSGFTDSSVVYVNGKRREDSSFVSSDKLLVPNNSGEIDPEDDIQVCQTGENRIILSTATRLS